MITIEMNECEEKRRHHIKFVVLPLKISSTSFLESPKDIRKSSMKGLWSQDWSVQKCSSRRAALLFCHGVGNLGERNFKIIRFCIIFVFQNR